MSKNSFIILFVAFVAATAATPLSALEREPLTSIPDGTGVERFTLGDAVQVDQSADNGGAFIASAGLNLFSSEGFTSQTIATSADY